MLVDDHPVVRAGYARLIELEPDIRVVAEADSAEAAYAACRDAEPPDVTVTDLSMPGAGGLELIRRFRARWPRCRLLVFSMHDGDVLVRHALEAGACGFLAKSSAAAELVQAIRTVHAGRPLASQMVPARRDDPAARLSELSEREFAVFRLIAEGLSPAECAQRLCVSAKTVSNHQCAIRDKLGLPSSAAWAHLALRCGVIESGTPGNPRSAGGMFSLEAPAAAR